MKRFRVISFLSLLIFFISCGGGGGSGGASGSGGGDTGAAPADDSIADTGNDVSKMETDLSSMEGSFSIPEGAVSVTLLGDAGIGVGNLGIYSMDGPDASEYVDNKFQRVIMPILFPGSTIARTIPDADYTPELAGTWNYRFTCGSCDLLTKKALWKMSEGSNLKVNIILVSQDSLSSVDDPNLLDVTDQFKAIFSGNGINVSDVKYSVIESEDTAMSSVDSDGNGQFDGMDRLFLKTSELALEDKDEYVHIFIVQSIGEGGVLGVAGGAPGPPITGTPHSGVIATSHGGASFDTSSERKILAETMAHEVGHYLGLYHTTEENGAWFDPITDTPECPSDDPTPGTCPDGTNLMFSFVDESIDQHILSEGQRFVLRRAHLIR